jgi:uracil-DNA glycosylase
MALDLDRRQRAMLQEMNVHVWWPEALPQGDVDAAAVAAPISAAPVAAHAGLNTTAATARAPTPTQSVAPPLASPPPGFPATPVSAQRPSGIAEMGWPALQTAVASCQACKLCGTRKNTVFGVGRTAPELGAAPRVDWLVVGEAPGENEDVQGEPFVGQAGKLLDNMLGAIGLSRQGEGGAGVFITNVLKCRPPGNRNPEPDEIAQCEPFLKRQIELLQPKVILAVGRFAVQSLLQASVPDVQTTPLGKLRGRVYRYHDVPVVVSYHPAYLLRSLPDKAKAWADLCLALDVMRKVSDVDA